MPQGVFLAQPPGQAGCRALSLAQSRDQLLPGLLRLLWEKIC